MIRHLSLIALALALGTLAWAQSQPPLPDVDRFGPQVGDLVPDFALPDQNGRIHTLRSILGPNGALLEFNRSADW